MVDRAIRLFGKCEGLAQDEQDARQVVVQMEIDPLGQIGFLTFGRDVGSPNTARLTSVRDLRGREGIYSFCVDELDTSKEKYSLV